MIKLVISDSGPLLSLAKADSLDLLISLGSHVNVVITDVVYYETTFRRELEDAQIICQFISKNSGVVTIEETSYGSVILEKTKTDPDYKVPADCGEMSIMSCAINKDEPALVLFEDNWFINKKQSFKGGTVFISTAAFIDLALERKLISQQKHDEIIKQMSSCGRNIENIRMSSDESGVDLEILAEFNQ